MAKKIARKVSKAPKAKKAKARNVGGGEFNRDILKRNSDWKAKRVQEARATHHGCKVNGKEFTSVYKAFVALSLPIWQHQAFRKALKIAKRLPFNFKGKTYNFVAIAH